MTSRTLLNISRGLALTIIAGAPFLLTSLPGVEYNVLWRAAPTLARYPATLMIADLFILAAGVCYLVAIGLQRPPAAWTDWLDWGPIVLVVAMGVSALTSVYKFASVLEVRRIADCVALFLLARALFREPRHRMIALWVLALSSGLAAVLGVRSYLRTAFVTGAVTWREFGTFGNPNSFAGLLIIAAPIAVALCAVYARRLHRDQRLIPFAVALVSAVLVLAALFLTGSKGGFLALFAAALAAVALLVWGLPRLRLRTKLGVLAIVLVALTVPLLLPPIKNRVLSAFTTQSHSGAFRWYTWKGTWRMIEAHPWLGTGPGTFVHAYQKYALVGFTRMAHNKDLQVWAECGVFALVALAATLMAYLVTAAVRVRRMDELHERVIPTALWAAVVAFCVHNLVDWDWYVPALCLTAWFVMGLSGPRPAAPSEAPEATSAMERRGKMKRRKKRKQVVPSSGRGVHIAYYVAVGLAAAYLAVLPVRTLAAARALTRGVALARMGDYRAAAAVLGRAARLSPLDAEPQFQLGVVGEALWRGTHSPSDLDGAIEAVWRAHELEPTDQRNLYWLAGLYSAGGQPRRAAWAARLAHEAAPNDTKVLVMHAQMAEAAGLRREAEEAWWELSKLWDDPERPVRRYSAVPDALPDFRYAHAWVHFAREEFAAGNYEESGWLLSRARDLLQRYLRQVARREGRKEELAAIGRWPPEGLSEARTLKEEADLLARELASREGEPTAAAKQHGAGGEASRGVRGSAEP